MKNGFKILQLLKQLEREQYMRTGKTALVEVVQCGATGSHVTGSMFCACATNPALFFLLQQQYKMQSRLGLRMRNRKQRNIRHSGVFSLEVPIGVFSRTAASYKQHGYRNQPFHWLSAPFPAILLALSIMVFTYSVFRQIRYLLQLVYHVRIAFFLYFQRS